MLNMTIEQFEKYLDELLELRKELRKKQAVIHCDASDSTVLCHENEVLLTFASRKGISVDVRRNADASGTCRYMYRFNYKDAEMLCYSTETEYLMFKEGGLVS